MALQDLTAERGMCFVDPHGDAVDALARASKATGRRDVTYVNVADPTSPYGYNPLRHIRRDRIPLAVSGVLEAMEMLWPNAWGVRMEHILRNALYALFEVPDATLGDILRLFHDASFRARVIASVSNKRVRHFWEHEFARYSKSYRTDGIAPIENKIGAFLTDPTLGRVLTAPKKDLRVRAAMDAGEVLLINLAKGRLGSDSANLLGSLLVTTVGLAALSRADLPPERRRPFTVFIDEFQSFTTRSTAGLTSELRKYAVGFTLAHQHLHQLNPDVRHAILGNAGTLISFRVGPEDASYLAREFAPRIAPVDLISLPNFEMYLRLMIDGAQSRAFSACSTNLNSP